MSVYSKLLSIQVALKAPKNQYNSFGKYKYRSCEDILEAVKPRLAGAGVALTVSDEITEIGGRVYVKATATLYDIEKPESVCVTAYAREEETKKGIDASQITGAASSYARKYALNGLFAIDDTKDSDTTNTGTQAAKQGAVQAKQETKAQAESPAQAPAGGNAQDISPVDDTIYCECCKKPILARKYTGKSGRTGESTAQQIASSSLKKYGKRLCFDCAVKEMNKGANQNA